MRFTPLALLLFFIGCKDTGKKEPLNMPGAYKMLSVSLKSDIADTTYTNQEQLKIYTGDFMMFAHINSPDSASGFGIGSYTIEEDTITENVIFDADDSITHDNVGSYKLVIEKTDKGYKQFIGGIIDNKGSKIDLTEVYESIGTGTVTPVDGAWKMTKRYTIKDKDSVIQTDISTQYKTYFAGYCIWGHTWKDSLNKIHAGIGYGKFSMNGDNKLKESMTVSTYSQVRGHDFDLDIELIGKDGFKQTINETDGTKDVEVYERLKK